MTETARYLEISIGQQSFDWEHFFEELKLRHPQIIWLDVTQINTNDQNVIFIFKFLPLILKQVGFPLGIDLFRCLEQELGAGSNSYEHFINQIKKQADAYLTSEQEPVQENTNNTHQSPISRTRILNRRERLLKKNKPKLLIVALVAALVCCLATTYYFGWITQMTHAQVEGKSMEPTFSPGDHVLIEHAKTFQRFDVIVFNHNKKEKYVKRIVGLPGESIVYEKGRLLINNQTVKDVYSDGTENFTLKDLIGESVIPDGYYFVLGDNRRNSLDSRSYGLIKESQIIGKIVKGATK